MHAKQLKGWAGGFGILAFLLVLLFVAAQAHPTILQFRYNPYALLSLTAFVANSILLIYMVRVRTKVNATYWYTLFLGTLVWWSGAEFLQRLSATAEGGLFWSTFASIAWVCIPVTTILFILSYVRKEGALRNPVFSFFLFISLLCLLYLTLSTDAFIPFTTSQLDLKPWGYNSGVENYFPVFLVWFESFYIASVVLLYQKVKTAKRLIDRKQTILFMIGLLIPMIIGTITDGVLPIFGINFYPMTVTLTTVNAIIITYAIQKYGLLVFNPITIASNILETMDEVVIVISPSYVIEYVNTRAEELLRYPLDELQGKPVESLFPHSYGALTKEVLTILHQDRFAHLEKSEVSTAGGKAIPVSISAARITDDNAEIKGYILTLTDTTKLEASLTSLQEKVRHIRKQNRDLTVLGEQLEKEKASVSRKVEDRTRELNKSRAQLMASINGFELGFIMINPHLEVVLMNDAVSNLLTGLHSKNARHTHTLAAGENSLHDIEQKFNATLNLVHVARTCMETKQSTEIKEVRSESSYFHMYLSPIILNQKVIGAVILIQDITEANVLNRSRDEFFSIASHELRTPLTAIMGYAALIKSLYTDKMADERFEHMMEGINEGGERMMRIVGDFLNMSRLEQGKLIFELTDLDLTQLAKEVIEELQPLADQKKLALTFHDSRQTLPLARGDRDRVKEILINLVGNALKFTDTGTIMVSAEVVDQNLCMRVHDTGKGIPVQNQAILFHKFQQAGSSLIAREASMGTGLGLYISKLMVEGMGGTIHLESSAPHHGSTFAFTLPLSKVK